MVSIFHFRPGTWMGVLSTCLAVVALLLGCGSGDGSGGQILLVDAEFNPATPSNATFPIYETEIAVAQTFAVQTTGRLEQFQIVLRQAAPTSTGMVRIDIRPLLGTGEPEPDDLGSIITPIDVDTTTLPDASSEDFTVFDLAAQPPAARQVVAGQEYAIVVTFLSRDLGAAGQPIATLLGRGGNEFAGGTGSTNPDNTGFTNIATDYFFRTFVLQ